MFKPFPIYIETGLFHKSHSGVVKYIVRARVRGHDNVVDLLQLEELPDAGGVSHSFCPRVRGNLLIALQPELKGAVIALQCRLMDVQYRLTRIETSAEPGRGQRRIKCQRDIREAILATAWLVSNVTRVFIASIDLARGCTERAATHRLYGDNTKNKLGNSIGRQLGCLSTCAFTDENRLSGL